MDKVVAPKPFTGLIFADGKGLCLAVEGEATTDSAGPLVALTEQVAKLEPQSRRPVLVLENDTRSCTILRSGAITGAIFRNNAQ